MAFPALPLLIFTVALTGSAWGQIRYDLLLKGGHVIDPANRIDGVMDVAVAAAKSRESPPIFPRARHAKLSTHRGSMSRRD